MKAETRARWTAVPGLVAGMALLSGLIIYGRAAEGEDGWLLTLDIAVAVVGCLLAPVALWRPVPVTLVLTVLAAVSPGATPAASNGAVQVAHRRRLPVAIGVAAAGVAAHAVQGLLRTGWNLGYGWWLLLITATYAALTGWGAAARARRDLLESLRERARRAEAEQGRRVAEARMLERTRMAREMHDVLAHRLSLLATYAGALEYRPDAPPEQLARAAGVVRAGVHQALDELREVIGVLRDGDADTGGGRPQPVLADVPALVDEARDAGGDVRLRDEVADPATLPPAAGRTAYRVIQEALTNARKHAPGQRVEVVLTGEPGTQLLIDVRNRLPANGLAEPLTPGTGTGLVGLTERVGLAGGTLDHQITRGEFRLLARLPWPA